MNPANDLVAYRSKQAQMAALMQTLKQRKQEQQAAQAEEQAARSTFSQIVQPLIGSIGNTAAGAVGGAGQLIGTGIEALTPFNSAGQSLRNYGTDFRTKIAQSLDNAGLGTMARPGENSFLVNTSSGLGSLLASMGSYGLAKGMGAGKYASSIPSAGFGASAGGEQSQGAIDAGKSPMQALLTGAVAGGAEAGLEKFGIDKYAGASGGLAKRLALRMATEGTQEALQSGAQSAIASTYSDVDPREAIKQALTEGMYGAVVGGIGDVSARAGRGVTNRVVKPVEAAYDGNTPGKGNKPVYIPAEVKKDIASIKGIDPTIRSVPIANLKLGAGTEGSYDQRVVDEYKAKMARGEKIDPMIVGITETGDTVVEDGKHRLEAAQTSNGIDETPVIYRDLGYGIPPVEKKKDTMFEAVQEAKQFANTGEYIKSLLSRGVDVSKGVDGIPYQKIFQAAQKQSGVVSGEALKQRLQNNQQQQPKSAAEIREQLLEQYEKSDPAMRIRQDTPISDIYGNKGLLKSGESVQAHRLKDGKIVLEDGKEWLLNAKAYENLKKNAEQSGEKPADFAPEMKGTNAVRYGGEDVYYTEDDIESITKEKYVSREQDKEIVAAFKAADKAFRDKVGAGIRGTGMQKLNEMEGKGELTSEDVDNLRLLFGARNNYEALESRKKGKWVIKFKDGTEQTYDADYVPNEANVKERVSMMVKERAPSTRYEEYAEPGGEDYREIVITDPRNYQRLEPWEVKLDYKDIGEGVLQTEHDGEVYRIVPKKEEGNVQIIRTSDGNIAVVDTVENAKQELATDIARIINRRSERSNRYKSSHWQDDNPVAHLRLDERTHDGKRITFIQEIQSDWAREARAEGFIGENKFTVEKTEPVKFSEPQYFKVYKIKNIEPSKPTYVKATSEAQVKKFREENDYSVERYGSRQDAFNEINSNRDTAPEVIDISDLKVEMYAVKNKNNQTEYESVDKEKAEAAAEKYTKERGVAKNELLANWQELTLKKALQEAVDRDSEYLAWTSGQQQAKRYNLSNEVDSMDYGDSTENEGVRDVYINFKGDGNKMKLGVDKSTQKIVEASRKESEFKGKKIGEIVGDKLAKTLMEDTGSQPVKRVSGDGLNMGGEWAKNLYDVQIPKILKKLTGQKAEVIEMGTGETYKELNEDAYETPDYQDAGGNEIDENTNDFTPGDYMSSEYYGGDFRVIQDNGSTFDAAPDDKVMVFNRDEDIRDRAESDIDEGLYEIRDELDKGITPTQAQNMIDTGDYSTNIENILQVIAEQNEKITKEIWDNDYNLYDKAYEKVYGNINDWYNDDLQSMYAWVNVEGDTVYALEDKDDLVTFTQPSRFDWDDVYKEVTDMGKQQAIKLTPAIKNRIKGLPAEVEPPKNAPFSRALQSRLGTGQKKIYGAALQSHMAKKPK